MVCVHCDRDNVTACDIQKFLDAHDCVKHLLVGTFVPRTTYVYRCSRVDTHEAFATKSYMHRKVKYVCVYDAGSRHSVEITCTSRLRQNVALALPTLYNGSTCTGRLQIVTRNSVCPLPPPLLPNTARFRLPGWYLFPGHSLSYYTVCHTRNRNSAPPLLSYYYGSSKQVT